MVSKPSSQVAQTKAGEPDLICLDTKQILNHRNHDHLFFFNPASQENPQSGKREVDDESARDKSGDMSEPCGTQTAEHKHTMPNAELASLGCCAASSESSHQAIALLGSDGQDDTDLDLDIASET